MTVRELRQMLSDIKDQNAVILIKTDDPAHDLRLYEPDKILVGTSNSLVVLAVKY